MKKIIQKNLKKCMPNVPKNLKLNKKTTQLKMGANPNINFPKKIYGWQISIYQIMLNDTCHEGKAK